MIVNFKNATGGLPDRPIEVVKVKHFGVLSVKQLGSTA
jgi:hypothetical protein